MSINSLIYALQTDLFIDAYADGCLFLSKAQYLLDASQEELRRFIKFLKTPVINQKIKVIEANFNRDSQGLLLNLMARCKALTCIRIISLDWDKWDPFQYKTLRPIIKLLRNKNLHTLELINCETSRFSGTFTFPRVLKILTNHFQTIKIKNLRFILGSGKEFVDHVMFGNKRLKHLIMENITFDWDEADDSKERYRNIFKEKLNALKHHPFLESLILKNISLVESDFCNSLCAEIEKRTATKFHKNGPLSLFWITAKATAKNLSVEEISTLPDDVKQVVAAASNFC